MTEYENLGGDSGVVAYEIFPLVIHVLFSSNMIYEYTYLKPGRTDVEEMKRLAAAGKGLNSYIKNVVKDRYSRKWSL